MSLPITATMPPRRVAAPSPRLGLDVERIRADFPILKQTVHGKPLIYFDNGATTQKPQAVLDALNNYYETENANVHRGVNRLSELATEAYEAARIKAQQFLGGHCLREIIFTRGTTEAINLVASSYGRSHVLAGDEILITGMEHHSNIVPWQMLCQERGARLRVASVTDTGELRLDEIEKLLSPKTKLVALLHVSNALGTINPVREVIALAHRRGVPVLLDGAQAVPHMRIGVQDLDCDFYAFSGHKVYGPTGIGVLYGKRELLEALPPYQGGGEMIEEVTKETVSYNHPPHRFEAGTPPIVQAIGLGAALDYIEGIGRARIRAHEEALCAYAQKLLSSINSLRIFGVAEGKGPIVSFTIEGAHAHDIATLIDRSGIAVRAGTHCAMPLLQSFGVTSTCRASFALYNTFDEVEALAESLIRARRLFQ
jgi:cysteine desulfurase / selenocysteine lyase